MTESEMKFGIRPFVTFSIKRIVKIDSRSKEEKTSIVRAFN